MIVRADTLKDSNGTANMMDVGNFLKSEFQAEKNLSPQVSKRRSHVVLMMNTIEVVGREQANGSTSGSKSLATQA